ncbi:MAG: phosphotransferase [Thermomicrobiales bacterium]
MLTTEIAGTPITADTPVDTAAEIVRAAGGDLARINSIPVQGYGWIKRRASQTEDRLRGSSRSRVDDRARVPAGYRATAGRCRTGPQRRHAAERLLDAIEIVSDDTGSVLAHGDFDTTHIFADEARYTGIIDFGEIRRACPGSTTSGTT